MYSELKIQRKHVLSSWSGIRPLAIDPHDVNDSKSTKSVSRDHIVSYNEKTGVVFVSGGKWTTYREMAEDGVNKILESPVGETLRTKAKECSTLHIDLVGKQDYSENLSGVILQEYNESISPSTASHLARAYGGNAKSVLLTAAADGQPPSHSQLVPGYPYIEAEVIYAVRHEYACRIEDIIARRTRLAFLNREAALAAIPRVAELMAKELNWSTSRRAEEIDHCIAFMQSFGGPTPLPSLSES